MAVDGEYQRERGRQSGAECEEDQPHTLGHRTPGVRDDTESDDQGYACRPEQSQLHCQGLKLIEYRPRCDRQG